MNSKGYLEIILGPMFSGKTSRLINVFKQCQTANIPCMVLNHNTDNRYSLTELSTHDGVTIPCHKISSLNEIHSSEDLSSKYKTSSIILINEAQFFGDLYEWVKNAIDNDKKTVYISGLDGDFERKMFGQILNLIPISDKVEKITALCEQCKDGVTPAIFSYRKNCNTNTEQMLIGEKNIYIPLCRACYLIKTI